MTVLTGRSAGAVRRLVGAAVLGLLVALVPVSSTAASDRRPGAVAAAPVDDCRLAAATDDLGEGFPINAQALRSTGAIRAALLFVDFSDRPAAAASLPAARANLLGGAAYLNTLAGGALTVSTRVSDRWTRMPEPSTSYPFARGITYQEHRRYILDAIAAADPTFDFAGVDVVWISATRTAPAISYSPTSNFVGATADGATLQHAVTFGFDQFHWGPLVVAHETGHVLGLPDLYEFAPADGDAFSRAGGFDLMGNIAGVAPEYLAWHRWMLGWLPDRAVACVRTSSQVRLSAVEWGSGTSLAVVPLDEHRAVVLESRRPIRYDRALPAGGVLIHLVDTSVRTGAGPVTVQDTRPATASLDDAVLTGGRTWTIPGTGVSVTVTAAAGSGDTVTVDVR